MALVAVVAGAGTYNHFRLIPVLEQAVNPRNQHLDPRQGPTVDATLSDPHGGVAVATQRQTDEALDRISRKLCFTAHAKILILLGVIALTAWLINASTTG